MLFLNILRDFTDSSYSVGTRRPCIIEPSLIERCRAILNIPNLEPSNHDQRMVAEILLYSKLYSLLQLQGQGDPAELDAWREQWDYLFRQEGHQYIEIGYYFAHLMLHAQALKLLDEVKSPGESPGGDAEAKKARMSAISQLSTQIFQRARRVEVSEIRVFILPFPFPGSNVENILPRCLSFPLGDMFKSGLTCLARNRHNLLHNRFRRRIIMSSPPPHPIIPSRQSRRI